MDSGAAAMDAMASEAAAGVADSVVTRLGQKNGQDLKSDGYRTWIVPKGRKADQETLKAYVNSKLCLVRLTLTPTPTLTRTRTRTRTRTLTLTRSPRATRPRRAASSTRWRRAACPC